MQSTIYVVTVTRGRRTRYSYGERLKDALAVAAPKIGERFTFAKFKRGSLTKAEFHGKTIVEFH